MAKKLVSALQYVAFVRDEGRGFHIEFPDAPGCRATAEGAELLYKAAKEAIENWLRAQLAAGEMPSVPHMHRPPAGNERRMHVEVSPGLVLAVEIRRMRGEKGWSQADLAKILGVSQQQVAKLEAPDANRTEEMFTKIKRVAESHGVTLLVAFE